MNGVQRELGWLERVINARIEHYFREEGEVAAFSPPAPPAPEQGNDPYAAFLAANDLATEERLAAALALAAEIAPWLLDIFRTKNRLYDAPYAQFGGVPESTRHGFLPTVRTALFLLHGDRLHGHAAAMEHFFPHGRLYRRGVLEADEAGSGPADARLLLTRNAFSRALYGREEVIAYGPDFPAIPLESGLEWDEAVLSPHTREQLRELERWLVHGEALERDWGLGRRLGEGYRALFHGPPGTGKTLTATLLGKRTDRPVYRIDLSGVVSKYVGETEKNLEKVFARAERKSWILFFDEADALFAKRTGVESSNDRHANRESAYLLQRIERCANLVVLASNLKGNLDPAFVRRFQAVVYFPQPGPEERLELWRRGFGPKAELEKVELERIAREYDCSGALIMNVVRYAALAAAERGSREIREEEVVAGLKRELRKEGKMV